MRPGAELPMSHGAPTAAPTNATAPHSPWQSPVPYLFGGLAAMLGLIAFALLILACSYWKLSGYLDGSDQAGSGSRADGEGGGEKGSTAGAARPTVEFREHVVVIMAGDEKPTFLAMPAASRASAEPAADPVASSEDDKNATAAEECEVSSPSEGHVDSRRDERNSTRTEHESQ